MVNGEQVGLVTCGQTHPSPNGSIWQAVRRSGSRWNLETEGMKAFIRNTSPSSIIDPNTHFSFFLSFRPIFLFLYIITIIFSVFLK